MTVTAPAIVALPTSTTDRLLAVADLIEFHPERYQQNHWFSGDLHPYEVAGGAPNVDCETTACIAGWAVALSEGLTRWESWDMAGAEALGLDPTLAVYLFSGDLSLPVEEVADVLRRLAKLDEGERTLSNAVLVLTPAQSKTIVWADDE